MKTLGSGITAEVCDVSDLVRRVKSVSEIAEEQMNKNLWDELESLIIFRLAPDKAAAFYALVDRTIIEPPRFPLPLGGE